MGRPILNFALGREDCILPRIEKAAFSFVLPRIKIFNFKWALAPEGFVRPTRKPIRISECVYFVSTQTHGRVPFFRHERWARLMENVLNHYYSQKCSLHAFVIMADHLHLLITPFEALEKSVQLFKGRFSYRAKRELEWSKEIWQPGFTEHRVRDEVDWLNHIEYIRQNPVRARLTDDPALYRHMNISHKEFPQRLKPMDIWTHDVRAEARTLPSECNNFPPGIEQPHTKS